MKDQAGGIVTISFVKMIAVLAAAICLANTARAETRESIMFQKERIRISISLDRILVRGEYTLANKSSSSRSVWLFYPFPVDSLHPFPRDISVTSEKKRIPFTTGEKGIYFMIELLGESRVSVDVSYDQKCLASYACYVLKSTARWQIPLEQADFRIRIPRNIELKSMSYPADRVLEDRGSIVYSFTRKNFMPVEDLCFEWGKKNKDAK